MKNVDHNPTQNERIIKYLKEHGSITQIEALRDLGIMRLASRISDLRQLGYSITGKMINVTNRYGEKCSVKQYSFSNSCDKVDCPYYEPANDCPARDGCGGFERAGAFVEVIGGSCVG